MLSKFRNQMSPLTLRRVVPSLLIAAFMLGLLLAPSLVNTSQAQSGVVSIDPPSQEVGVGSTGFVDVRSDGLTNIYGAQIGVSFDAGQLQVVDADPSKAGVQVIPGTCPAPDFVVTNTANNTAGIVEYGATQLATEHPDPCSGGVIATIEFLCLETPTIEPVTVPITIFESIISDPDGLPLTHTVQHGEIICQPGCPVFGQVDPQGYAETVEVCVDGTDCVTLGPDFSFNLVVPTGVHRFSADSIHHLASEVVAECINNEPIQLGTTKLRAGDLNEDGTINILDLTMIGGNFNKTEPTPWGP